MKISASRILQLHATWHTLAATSAFLDRQFNPSSNRESFRDAKQNVYCPQNEGEFNSHKSGSRFDGIILKK